jgi:hypothetical protein
VNSPLEACRQLVNCSELSPRSLSPPSVGRIVVRRCKLQGGIQRCLFMWRWRPLTALALCLSAVTQSARNYLPYNCGHSERWLLCIIVLWRHAVASGWNQEPRWTWARISVQQVVPLTARYSLARFIEDESSSLTTVRHQSMWVAFPSLTNQWNSDSKWWN